VKEINRQFATYAFVAVVFFLWGLKVNWWDSIDRAVNDCRIHQSFQHEDTFLRCYVVSDGRDKYP